MKYALLVLGLLLIAGGGYFIYTGSNIIEIERGWSSVIAGTTALSAGIVTLGLAGVVKALDDVKQALIGAQIEAAATNATKLAGTMTAEATLAPEPLPSVDASAPLTAEAPPDVPPSLLGRERPRLTPSFGSPPAPSPAIAELRRRVVEDLEFDLSGFSPPPIAPAHEPVDVDPGTEAISPPPLDFDQYDLPRHDLPRHDEPAVDEALTQPFSYEDEPPPASEPAFTAPAKSKAIGRYEADGTVYVMFADGSIEAQSAQGTRYFKSMADLKASFQSEP